MTPMKAKLLTFALGLLVGVLSTIFVPRVIGPRLPAGLRSEVPSVEGTVIRRQRDGERLLLTINTPQGASLATFTEKVAEIDLLVAEGDAVTLGLGAYEPFVENPPIRAVQKSDSANTGTPPMAPDQVPAAIEPAAAEVEAIENPMTEGEAEPAEQAPEPELEEWPSDNSG